MLVPAPTGLPPAAGQHTLGAHSGSGHSAGSDTITSIFHTRERRFRKGQRPALPLSSSGKARPPPQAAHGLLQRSFWSPWSRQEWKPGLPGVTAAPLPPALISGLQAGALLARVGIGVPTGGGRAAPPRARPRSSGAENKGAAPGRCAEGPVHMEERAGVRLGRWQPVKAAFVRAVRGEGRPFRGRDRVAR